MQKGQVVFLFLCGDICPLLSLDTWFSGSWFWILRIMFSSLLSYSLGLSHNPQDFELWFIPSAFHALHFVDSVPVSCKPVFMINPLLYISMFYGFCVTGEFQRIQLLSTMASPQWCWHRGKKKNNCGLTFCLFWSFVSYPLFHFDWFQWTRGEWERKDKEWKHGSS